MPYGTTTVLRSHSCVALSPVAARVFYQTMLDAQSDKLEVDPIFDLAHSDSLPTPIAAYLESQRTCGVPRESGPLGKGHECRPEADLSGEFCALRPPAQHAGETLAHEGASEEEVHGDTSRNVFVSPLDVMGHSG